MNLLNALCNYTGTTAADWQSCGEPAILSQLGLKDQPGTRRAYLHHTDGRLILVREYGREIHFETLPHKQGEPVTVNDGHAAAHKLIAKELRHHLIQKDSSLEKLSLVGSMGGIVMAAIVMIFTIPAHQRLEIEEVEPLGTDTIRSTAAIVFWMSMVFALYILAKKGRRLLASRKQRARKLHEVEADNIIERWEAEANEVVPLRLGTKPVSNKTKSIILDILRTNLPKTEPCQPQDP